MERSREAEEVITVRNLRAATGATNSSDVSWSLEAEIKDLARGKDVIRGVGIGRQFEVVVQRIGLVKLYVSVEVEERGSRELAEERLFIAIYIHSSSVKQIC